VNFGEKVRQLRAERNLTQPQLAQLIGIEQSYLSKLENDKSVPSADIFQAILKAQVNTKIHSIKTWLFASGIALALGLTLGIAGMRGLLFSNTQFNYESPGILLPGESTDFFETYGGVLFQQEQAGVITDKERAQRTLEINRRRVHDYRLLDDYRGKAFTEEVPGGQRTWFFQRASDFRRPENRWLMLAGVLFTFGGITGFIVEARLRQVRL
jgi:transcriptional regulator with XRE-family HTH domain